MSKAISLPRVLPIALPTLCGLLALAPVAILSPSRAQAAEVSLGGERKIASPSFETQQRFLYGGHNFERVTPQWGVQLQTSLRPMAGEFAIDGAEANPPAITGRLMFEYQPKQIQAYGVLSAGVFLEGFTGVATEPGIQHTDGSWGAGGLLRYQFRYSTHQVVVPMAGFSSEVLHYHFLGEGFESDAETEGRMLVSGPMLGAWLYLNELDPWAASAFLDSAGVARTYFTLEMHHLMGGNEELQISGNSFFAGLRFEF